MVINKRFLLACGIFALMLVILVSGCTKSKVSQQTPGDLANPGLNTVVLDVMGVT